MVEAIGQLLCHPMSIPIGYGTSGLGNLYETIPDSVGDATLAEQLYSVEQSRSLHDAASRKVGSTR